MVKHGYIRKWLSERDITSDITVQSRFTDRLKDYA